MKMVATATYKDGTTKQRKAGYDESRDWVRYHSIRGLLERQLFLDGNSKDIVSIKVELVRG